MKLDTTIVIAVVGAVQAVIIVAIPVIFGRRLDQNRMEDKADRADVARKVEGTQETVGQIHTAVNTNYATLTAELVRANDTIAGLESRLGALITAKTRKRKTPRRHER